MGRLQSRVIGEVVAPVALLSGIALSPEVTVRYGRHRRKTVISLRWPSLVLLVIGSTPPSSSHRSRPVAQLQPNALLCGIAPSRSPPGPCSLLISWSLLLLSRTQWLGLAVGVSDLPPLPLTGHALFLVRFPVDLPFLLPSCHTLRYRGYGSPTGDTTSPWSMSSGVGGASHLRAAERGSLRVWY